MKTGKFPSSKWCLKQGGVFFQQGNAFQGPRKADTVAREKVTELIQVQAQRILALKEEIALLRKKGGLILPPIHPPQENEWSPWVFKFTFFFSNPSKISDNTIQQKFCFLIAYNNPTLLKGTYLKV